MNRIVRRLAYASIALASAALIAFGAIFFLADVHTVTIDNRTNEDLRDVQVQVSGKTLWQGDIPARGRKWVFGTQPPGVISDRDRRLIVSMNIEGQAAEHDFGYVTLAESHYLGIMARNELQVETFCRCFF